VDEGIECNMPDYKSYSYGTGANKLGSVTIHDLSVGYKTSWDGRFLVGVNNVFDKKPRVVYESAADASKVDADLSLDRFFYVRYTQNF
jgi:iron complex outermembrane receptor protein